MGTIADKLTYLNGTKTAIKEAIKAKGVTVTDTDTFRSYATKIGEISGGGAPATKYGCPVGGLLGNVDENGAYQFPTEPFTLDLSAVKSLPNYGLMYKFYYSTASGALTIGLEGDLNGSDAMSNCFSHCTGLTSVDLSSLTTISGSQAMNSCFVNCEKLTSIDLSSLTTVSGFQAMGSCFSHCTGLTSVDLSSLTTVSGTQPIYNCFSYCNKLTSIDLSSLTTVDGSYAMNSCFVNCEKLTSIDLSSLTTVSGSQAMGRCFTNCSSLTTISFPALKEILPTTTQNQFDYIFDGCVALTEIHFPSNMEERISQLTRYNSKFGAPNATIFFDL